MDFRVFHQHPLHWKKSEESLKNESMLNILRHYLLKKRKKDMKKHKVLIFGGHGYIGNALISYLQSEGNYTIASFDNNSRERLVKEVGSDSLVEPKYHELVKTGDVTEYCDVISWLKHFQPDTIIHLAEQPSAPYSMKSIENA